MEPICEIGTYPDRKRSGDCANIAAYFVGHSSVSRRIRRVSLRPRHLEMRGSPITVYMTGSLPPMSAHSTVDFCRPSQCLSSLNVRGRFTNPNLHHFELGTSNIALVTYLEVPLEAREVARIGPRHNQSKEPVSGLQLRQ